MKKTIKILASIAAVCLPTIIIAGVVLIVIMQPLVAVAKLWDQAMDYFGYFLSSSTADMDRWMKRDLARLSSFPPDEYENYYLAQAVSYFYYAENGQSIVSDSSGWSEYMNCFRDGKPQDCFRNVELTYGYYLDEERKSSITAFSKDLKRQYILATGSRSSGSGVIDIGDVRIDFGGMYYTYSSDTDVGNPCVCDAYNNSAWPYDNCNSLSSTGGWNKMICSSYAAGRYWEVNYPDDPFPLSRGWDNDLHYSNMYAADYQQPIERSIVGIAWNGIRHDAFIETVFPDGSVIISECNINMNTSDDPVVREYGFRVGRYSSLKEWMSSFSPRTTLVGMVPPE